MQMNVFCEGQTEQGFCDQVLRPHLFPDGRGIIHTLAVGEKDHRHVYGIGRRTKYPRVRKFILNTIKQRAAKDVFFTTLFDLYALPDDFPGKAANVRNPVDPTPYVLALEEAFGKDIDCPHFIPYLQLHEYEAILFVDPDAFRVAFDHCDAAVDAMKATAAGVKSVEHIDDGSTTAPSKRIIAALPEYDGRKPTAGPDIAEYIGVTRIRAACPHFHGWLTRLESIVREAG